MPKAKQESKMQMIIAILLGVAGLLILLIFLVIRSQADDVGTEGEIGNAEPYLVEPVQVGLTTTGNEVVDDGLNLTEDSSTTIYVNGSFVDLNGCDEVTAYDANNPEDAIGGVVWREDIAWSILAENGTSTYSSLSDFGGPGPGCVLTCTPEDIQGSYYCPIQIQHYADATVGGPYDADDWAVNFNVFDGVGSGGVWAATTTFEINTLAAVDVGTSVNYGSVSIAATSTEVALEIKNTGNDNTTDITMVGTDMGCTTGTIAVGDQWFGLVSGTHENQLDDTVSSTVDLNLAKQQYDAEAVTAYTTQESTTTVYWALNITEPTGGDAVAGTCTGTTTIYGQSSI